MISLLDIRDTHSFKLRNQFYLCCLKQTIQDKENEKERRKKNKNKNENKNKGYDILKKYLYIKSYMN